MAARAAVLQGCGTLLAAADEVMTGGAEEPTTTKPRRAVYEHPSCRESVYRKMLANEAALLDPASREARQFRGRCRLPYQVFKKIKSSMGGRRNGIGRWRATS